MKRSLINLHSSDMNVLKSFSMKKNIYKYKISLYNLLVIGEKRVPYSPRGAKYPQDIMAPPF